MTTQELVERLRRTADLPDTSRIDPLLAKVMTAIAELMAASADRLSEMEAENKRLREALADLTSWFTLPMISGKVWIIPAGKNGADDAVNAARAALEHQQKGETL